MVQLYRLSGSFVRLAATRGQTEALSNNESGSAHPARSTDWGTNAVLIVDLAATLGVVVFAITYTKDNPWVFAPVLLVTLFLSLLVAGLVHQSNRARQGNPVAGYTVQVGALSD